MYETNSWQFRQAVSKTYPPSAICRSSPPAMLTSCKSWTATDGRKDENSYKKKAAKYDVHIMCC
jgi:hypothetical protein